VTLIVKTAELNQSSGSHSALSRIVRFMLIITAIIVAAITMLSGCVLISSQYVPSSPLGARPAKSPSEILVYYSPKEIQFEYEEIGRVFVKNINYWADRDPGAQTGKIISEAADHGADAVVIQGLMRYEASSVFFSQGFYGGAGSNAGQVFQMSGIAVIRKR
jgi:hypothetical protein